jgi:tRNA(Phe) wybutosine-synthesizing methylase Tyw3
MEIGGRRREIDSCIFDFVRMLNENDYRTIASCCGHGRQPASIIYEKDGVQREIRIMTFEQARKIDKLFPAIHDREYA